MPETTLRRDIASREEIILLVDTFYDQVRADPLLGPIFDEVARVDWSMHLPRMYDFWEAVLFGAATFKGNPLAVHQQLAMLTPLTREAFERWLQLFHGTVDALFDGSIADEAKMRSARIASVMLYHVGTTARAAIIAP
jgi:hemoglobin